ncbi:hypothetical protein H2200_013220 [Cladophialophora chaetospira]|uniref:Uncharacterized protein n=1 Tax=Cladophialophora chaetospira TaxID=386627 RepID=A0AA38WWD2_9EURO|nr:hypothetical protein H2200_013220 [Cladophialophora chaetospira]
MDFTELPVEIQIKILENILPTNIDWTIGAGNPDKRISSSVLAILQSSKLRKVAMPIVGKRVNLYAAVGNVCLLQFFMAPGILKEAKSLCLFTTEYSTAEKPFDHEAAQKTLRSLDSRVRQLLPKLEVFEVKIELGQTHIAQVDYHFAVLARSSEESPKPYQTRFTIVQYVNATNNPHRSPPRFRVRKEWTVTQKANSEEIEVERSLCTERRDGEQSTPQDDIGRSYTACLQPPFMICCHCFRNVVSVDTDAIYFCTLCCMSVYCSCSCWVEAHHWSQTHLVHGCAYSKREVASEVLELHPIRTITTKWAGSVMSFRDLSEQEQNDSFWHGPIHGAAFVSG